MEDLEDIYRTHAQTVYRYLLSLTRDADLAEELTQETFYSPVRSSAPAESLPTGRFRPQRTAYSLLLPGAFCPLPGIATEQKNSPFP